MRQYPFSEQDRIPEVTKNLTGYDRSSTRDVEAAVLG